MFKYLRAMAQTASPKHPRASHFEKSGLFGGLKTFSELLGVLFAV